MSVPGQTRKYSPRVDVFRSSLKADIAGFQAQTERLPCGDPSRRLGRAMLVPLFSEGEGPWKIAQNHSYCEHKPALEQGQADRGEAAAALQTCLVDSDEAPDQGTGSGPF